MNYICTFQTHSFLNHVCLTKSCFFCSWTLYFWLFEMERPAWIVKCKSILGGNCDTFNFGTYLKDFPCFITKLVRWGTYALPNDLQVYFLWVLQFFADATEWKSFTDGSLFPFMLFISLHDVALWQTWYVSFYVAFPVLQGCYRMLQCIRNHVTAPTTWLQCSPIAWLINQTLLENQHIHNFESKNWKSI